MFFVNLDGPSSLDSGDLSQKDEGTSTHLSHLGALGNHLKMMVKNPEKSGKPGSTVSKVANTDMNLCNSGFFMAGESNHDVSWGENPTGIRVVCFHNWRKC